MCWVGCNPAVAAVQLIQPQWLLMEGGVTMWIHHRKSLRPLPYAYHTIPCYTLTIPYPAIRLLLTPLPCCLNLPFLSTSDPLTEFVKDLIEMRGWWMGHNLNFGSWLYSNLDFDCSLHAGGATMSIVSNNPLLFRFYTLKNFWAVFAMPPIFSNWLTAGIVQFLQTKYSLSDCWGLPLFFPLGNFSPSSRQ